MIECISLVYVALKMNCRNLSNLVQFVMKTKQDNNMTDRIGAIYTKNDNELSRLIVSDVICDETKQNNDMTNRIGAVYIENETELS